MAPGGLMLPLWAPRSLESLPWERMALLCGFGHNTEKAGPDCGRTGSLISGRKMREPCLLVTSSRGPLSWTTHGLSLYPP